MKELSKKSQHATDVLNCITDIHKDMSKLNFKHKTLKYKESMTNIVISEKCELYGLKIGHIKMILGAMFFKNKEEKKKEVIYFSDL